MEQSNYEKRRIGIHLLRSGKSPAEVAQELNRHPSWVYKWRKRYKENGWEGLQDSSRIPKRQVTKLPASVWQAIRQARSELEAEAQEPGKLSYIGARSVLARLQKWKIEPLPSITSIERELRRAGMIRPKQSVQEEQVDYPHLDVKQPHRLVQVDIVPRYLPGGSCVSSFNAIDVASCYPAGQQYLKTIPGCTSVPLAYLANAGHPRLHAGRQ